MTQVARVDAVVSRPDSIDTTIKTLEQACLGAQDAAARLEAYLGETQSPRLDQGLKKRDPSLVLCARTEMSSGFEKGTREKRPLKENTELKSIRKETMPPLSTPEYTLVQVPKEKEQCDTPVAIMSAHRAPRFSYLLGAKAFPWYGQKAPEVEKNKSQESEKRHQHSLLTESKRQIGDSVLKAKDRPFDVEIISSLSRMDHERHAKRPRTETCEPSPSKNHAGATLDVSLCGPGQGAPIAWTQSKQEEAFVVRPTVPSDKSGGRGNGRIIHPEESASASSSRSQPISQENKASDRKTPNPPSEIFIIDADMAEDRKRSATIATGDKVGENLANAARTLRDDSEDKLQPFKSLKSLPITKLSASKTDVPVTTKTELPYLGREACEKVLGGLLDDHWHASNSRQWHGQVIHVDFNDQEICELLSIMLSISPFTIKEPKIQIEREARAISSDRFPEIARHARTESESLRNRSEESIQLLLFDARNSRLPNRAKFLRFNSIFPRYHPAQYHARVALLFLHNDRQVGHKVHFKEAGTPISLRMKPWRAWTGASNDVLTVAWHPQGTSFAVGSSAITDQNSMQYNRRNNLLFGNLISNMIHELSDHHIARPKPNQVTSGSNSLHATYEACDPKLYTSVPAVCFSRYGDYMYTGSYDSTVKIWKISSHGSHQHLQTLHHDAEVDLIAVSSFHDLFATGSKSTVESIRVYEQDSISSIPIVIPSSSQHIKKKLHPVCLQWGTTEETQHLLLCGFASIDETSKTGDLYLWDKERQKQLKVSPSAQSIFAATWHPSQAWFATASTPNRSNIAYPRTTRSVVRIYTALVPKTAVIYSAVEYECPALDINDIAFHPWDDNYISASCTNGKVYFWDFSNPDQIAFVLEHAPPLADADPNLDQELSDTGVRMMLWNRDSRHLYTGSSDGVVKVWDVSRAPGDMLVKDAIKLDSEIMCGEFSPDYTNLLIGETSGAIHVLSTAPINRPDRRKNNKRDWDDINDLIEPTNNVHKRIRQFRRSTNDPDYESSDDLVEPMSYLEDPANAYKQSDQSNEDNYDGAEAARELVSSGKIEMHPIFGAGKGPAYDGPFASWGRPETGNPFEDPLLPEVGVLQLDEKERMMGRYMGGTASAPQKKAYRSIVSVAKARNSATFIEDLVATKQKD